MLNPATAAKNITGEIRKSDIPYLTEAQIKFGYVPNIGLMRPGDLLLTQPVDGSDWLSRAISFCQKKVFKATKTWTHAAVYARDWRIVEARPATNVANSTLLSWIPHTKILVRRPTIYVGMPADEAIKLGLTIALEAAMLQGSAVYGKKQALSSGWRMVNRKRSFSPFVGETHWRSLLCSGLYVKCYNIATGGQLLSSGMLRDDVPVVPSVLASISTLESVEIGWLRLI